MVKLHYIFDLQDKVYPLSVILGCSEFLSVSADLKVLV